MKSSRRKLFSPDGRLIFILISVVLILVLVFSVIFIGNSTKIKYDIVYNGVSGEGLLIRDETYVDLSGYEKLDYEQFIDGDEVKKNQTVVTAYKKGYIKTTLEKLAETEKNIVAYQNQSIISSYDDKKITKYDFEIDVTIRNMSEDSRGFIQLYSKLCSLMNERESYIRETYNTDSNTYIQQLFSDEKSLTESLSAWCDTFTAQNDGHICFYCDGYENDLTFDFVESLNGQTVKNYLNKDYECDNASFKIINGEKWYVVISVKNVDGFTEGLSYPVYIGNSESNEIGLLEKIISDKKGNALVFSIEDNVEKYIDKRTCDVFLGERFEGYSIKSNFINNNTITIKKDKIKTEIPINVIYSDSDKTIFSTEESISVNRKVYKK